MIICRTCKKEKSEEEYYLRNSGVYRIDCKICYRKRVKNKEKIPEELRVNKTHAGVPKEFRHQSRVLWYRYKVTVLDILNFLEKQNNICGNPNCDTVLEWPHNNTHVDHCHITGKVRGVLCVKCNLALGSTDDNIQKLQGLIKYLRKHEKKT